MWCKEKLYKIKNLNNCMKFYSSFVSSFVSSVSIFFVSLFCMGVVSAQTFQVSAYYSPLPNQNAYVSGSYAVDLKMNGNGTHGADGTPVYVGMISAPSKYAYGTKIFIPGLGVGTVHDRGGAIYSAKGYDRLDIWMGYGDEGRKRALQWGRQMVEGSIVASDTKEGFVFGGVVVKDKNMQEVSPEQPVANEYFSTNLWLHINNDVYIKEEIKKIQAFLGSKQTGYYGHRTEKFVFDFQVAHGIVSSMNDFGAGTWGPKTRSAANAEIEKQKKQEGREVSEVSTFEAVRK